MDTENAGKTVFPTGSKLSASRPRNLWPIRMVLHPRRSPVALLLILLLALALRLAPWGQNRFLEDEALYAYWGLQIATGTDPMLNNEPVDKPPLHPYLLALSFRLLGQNETAARLPSLLASIASIALTYALARQFPPAPHGEEGPGLRGGDERAALLAALLLALSPFDILFASTAFTDPLLTMWMLAALLAAARDHPGAAGVLAGLAAATKQQGLLCLPLIAAVGMIKMADAQSRTWDKTARFVAGFAVVVAGVVWWDAARTQRPGFWQQSLISYGGLGLVQPQNLAARAAGWLRLVGLFWGSPWFNALLMAAIVAWTAGSRVRQTPLPGLRRWNSLLQGPRLMDWALLIFIAGFLLVHWLVSFQVWDRYLLPLVPLTALLGGRALVAFGRALPQVRQQQVYTFMLPLILVALLVGPVYRATRSELPVGGDHGAYDGIEQLAAYLHATAPPGAVLYHHWLGYHYRFYLYGAPLRLHWYPDPEDLVHDATVYRREPRYIAFPSFRDSAPIKAALSAANIYLVPLFQTTRRDGTVSFQLYRLQGP